MDYFIVLLLILIIFTFLSDKKIVNIKELKNKIGDLNKQIDEIYNEILIINLDEETKENEEVVLKYINKKIAQNNFTKYLIIKDKNIELTTKELRTIIANFINEKERICGFMPTYDYQYVNHKSLKDIKEELEVAIINYLNIFSKSSINKYGVIILKVSEVNELYKKIRSREIVNFTPIEDIKVVTTKNRTNNLLKHLEIIYDSDINIMIKSVLLIIVGVSVTANLVYAIYRFDITMIIVASIMYWCYQYVLKYMYKPIGRYKIVAKYLFPIFFSFYLLLIILNSIKRRKNSNKNVQAS